MAEAAVLDLFAGSGALGFEALSRGARSVTFVEADAHVARRLRSAAQDLGVAERCRVIAAPAERALERIAEPFDLVFADPPYALGFPARALEGLRRHNLLAKDGMVVFEHSARLAPATPGFVITRAERYGEVAISFLQAEDRS